MFFIASLDFPSFARDPPLKIACASIEPARSFLGFSHSHLHLRSPTSCDCCDPDFGVLQQERFPIKVPGERRLTKNKTAPLFHAIIFGERNIYIHRSTETQILQHA
jgi:hypothetical protein